MFSHLAISIYNVVVDIDVVDVTVVVGPGGGVGGAGVVRRRGVIIKLPFSSRLLTKTLVICVWKVAEVVAIVVGAGDVKVRVVPSSRVTGVTWSLRAFAMPAGHTQSQISVTFSVVVVVVFVVVVVVVVLVVFVVVVV